MNKIVELREKRTKAWEDAKAFLDARASDGVLSAEDAAIYDKMEKDVVDLGNQIERLERQIRLDAELSRPTSSAITEIPSGNRKEKSGRSSDEYRKSFWDAMRSKSMSGEAYNALQVGTDSEGGYLVPDEFEHTLVKALENANVIRQLATQISTASGDRKIPIVASKGTASWINEEGTIPESDDSFSQVSLGSHKLATLVKVSDELLNDNVFDLETYFAEEFGRRFGTKEEEGYLTGDGSGKPAGILAATGGAQVGVTAASATTITFDEIIDLYYSLKAAYRPNAVFLANDASIKILRKLKDSNGQYIWQPSVAAGTPDTILNRPVYTSDFMPTAASGAKTLVFGDFSYYWIANRQPPVFKRLNELYAASGQVGFLGNMRVDGKLILPEAIQCLQQKASA